MFGERLPLVGRNLWRSESAGIAGHARQLGARKLMPTLRPVNLLLIMEGLAADPEGDTRRRLGLD